jgi:23S rRNA pseudouridine955/2504/2580 synthase
LLFQRGDWKPALSGTFRPALVNRIDRNTGGIVIAAKSAAALHILSEKIRSREIDKYYLAELIGVPDPPNGKLEGYVFKDAKQNRVYVSEHSSPGSKLAVTEYKTLKVKGGFSLVECRLLTGRTHQIRAQFAAAGLPLSGDGKYGVAPARGGGQALYSYKLTFAFTSPAGELEYLNGKTFIAPLGGTGLPLAAELQITDFEA